MYQDRDFNKSMKNGQLLNWLKSKKKLVKFLKIWAHFLGAHTDSAVWKYVLVQL